MNPKKISFFLLLTGILFSSSQIFSQSDTTVVIREDQEICYGTQPELLISVVDPLPDGYQWQNSTDIIQWENIDTATREVFQPPVLTETTKYRLIVTYNNFNKNGFRSVTDTSNILTVTVYGEFHVGSITSSVSGPVCYGNDGGTLTAHPSGGSEDYTVSWIAGGDTVGTGLTYDVGNVFETQSFYYYVKDNKGCGEGISDTVTIEVYDELIAGDITGGNSPICSGDDGGLLRSHPSGGSGSYTIKWYKNDGIFLHEGQSLEVGALTETTDFYYIIEDEECGEEQSDPKTIVVMDVVQVDITISVTPGNEICSGETAYFTAEPVNGGSDPSYQWMVNNIHVGTDADHFESSTLQTGDKVTCQLTSDIECAEGNPAISNEIEMVVNQPGEANIQIEADKTEVCPDEIITFNTEIQNGGESPYFEWYVNDLPQSIHTGTFVLESPEDGDAVKASVKSSAPCVDTSFVYSEEIEITVNPVPVINDLWVKPTPEIGRPVVLIVCCLDSDTDYTYTWYKDGEPIPGANGQYYYKEGGIENGTYYVEVGNSYQCTSVSQTYTYPSNKELFVEHSSDIFSVYPNPSNGKFNIELNNELIPIGVSSVKANVYTVTGERVFSGSIVNTVSQIDLRNLNNGIYFLELNIANGERQIKKLSIY